MQGLNIQLEDDGSTVAITGRLDIRSAGTARAALASALNHHQGDLLVNAEGLEIWGSAGLGVFHGLGRRASRERRRVVLCGMPAREVRMLRAAKIGHYFCFEKDIPRR